MTKTDFIDSNLDKMQWREAVPGESIHSNEVHVWRVSLDITLLQLESLLKKLSADEVARAGRFRFERDRKRFITARGMLRQLLGCYLREDPHKLQFDYTPYGKPILASTSNYHHLSFNLSHSGEFALYAVTRGRSIGVDIERIRNDIAVEQIAQRFFSPGEISAIDRIHKNKHEVFFQYWTRKEAFLKAIGEGISFPMQQCDISLLNASVLSPITVIGYKLESSSWYGMDLLPAPGYTAALAIEGGNRNLSCWHYSACAY